MKDLNFFAHAKAKIHHPAKAPSDGVFFSQKPHKDGKEIFVGDKVLFEACDWEVRFGFHKVLLIEEIDCWQYAYGFYLWSDFLKAEEPIDKNTMGDSEFIGSIYGENPTRNVYGEKEKSN